MYRSLRGYPAILLDVDVLVRLESSDDVVGEFDAAIGCGMSASASQR